MRLAMIIVFTLTLPLHAAAFWAGADVWLGFGPVAVVLLFLVCALLLGVGGLAYMSIAFQGAVLGWGWSFWAAALMILPAAAFTAYVLIALGVLVVLDRVRPEPD